MSDKSSFRESLKQARKTVDTWPEWKQRALGGGPSSPRWVEESGQVKRSAQTRTSAPAGKKPD